MINPSNPLADISHDDDACADCGVAIHGDDNASAYGDNMNVCDDCEVARETAHHVEDDGAKTT
jgi:hypothetical protein